MRAMLIVPTTDGAGTLRETDVPEPTIAPGQVLIDVRAASVNRADLAMRAGSHSSGTADGPLIAGLDASGVVVDVGPGVETLTVGDRVMTMAAGGLAERVAVHADMAVPIPDQWSFEEGAAAILGLMTEHNALRTAGRMDKGDSVLIHAATSGVGLQATALARHFGAGLVIATSRSHRADALLREVGADLVVDTSMTDFADAVLDATDGTGVDIVVDHVGGPYLAANIRCMAIGGRLVGVGRLGGALGDLDMETLALKRLELIGVTFRTRTPEQKAAVVADMRGELDAPLKAGHLRPTIDRVISWTDAVTAQQVLADNAHLGKIVLAVAA